jgi:hypothetical protein
VSVDRERIDLISVEVEKRLGLPEESIFFNGDCLVIHVDVIAAWLERTPPTVSPEERGCCGRCGSDDLTAEFRETVLCPTCVGDVLTEHSMGVYTPKELWNDNEVE